MTFCLRTAVVGRVDDRDVIAIALIDTDNGALVIECDPIAALTLWKALGSVLKTTDFWPGGA